MRSILNPAQKGHIFDKAIEIARVAGRGNRSYDRILRSMQDIVDGRFAPDNDDLQQLFISPEDQIQNVRRWNQRYKWGFSEEDFEQLKPPPSWPTGHLCAIVLVPYLRSRKSTYEGLQKAIYGDGLGGGTYGYTFLSPVGFHDEMKGLDHESDDYVRHYGGAQLYTGLQWRIVSLGANRSCRPEDLEGQTPAAAEILAAAAHFPNWVRAMNGRDVPVVWLGGYKLMFDCSKLDGWWNEGRVGLHAALYFNPAEGRPRFYIPDQRFGSERAAVPVVLW